MIHNRHLWGSLATCGCDHPIGHSGIVLRGQRSHAYYTTYILWQQQWGYCMTTNTARMLSLHPPMTSAIRGLAALVLSMYVFLTHTEVHEFFHYHIIPVSVALWFHRSLSNSEGFRLTSPDPLPTYGGSGINSMTSLCWFDKLSDCTALWASKLKKNQF